MTLVKTSHDNITALNWQYIPEPKRVTMINVSIILRNVNGGFYKKGKAFTKIKCAYMTTVYLDELSLHDQCSMQQFPTKINDLADVCVSRSGLLRDRFYSNLFIQTSMSTRMYVCSLGSR